MVAVVGFVVVVWLCCGGAYGGGCVVWPYGRGVGELERPLGAPGRGAERLVGRSGGRESGRSVVFVSGGVVVVLWK